MASFGPSQAQQDANNQQKQITSTATTNAGTDQATGQNLIGLGGNKVQAGASFFNNILNGNQAQTASELSPEINQIRQGTQQSLQAASNLMPRGGGRSQALFSTALAPAQQITDVFNRARTNAATILPQIGLQEQGVGTGVLSAGNQALSTGSSSNASLAGALQKQEDARRAGWSALGGGLFNLATLPMGGGGSLFGSLMKMGSGGGGGYMGGGG